MEQITTLLVAITTLLQAVSGPNVDPQIRSQALILAESAFELAEMQTVAVNVSPDSTDDENSDAEPEVETDPATRLMREFLAAPSKESFVELCEKGGSVEVEGYTKEGLDEVREEIVQINETLSEVLGCHERIYFYKTEIALTPNSLVIQFDEDDTDTQRMGKIDFRDRISRYLSESTFVLVADETLPYLSERGEYIFPEGEKIKLEVYFPEFSVKRILEAEQYGVGGAVSWVVSKEGLSFVGQG